MSPRERIARLQDLKAMLERLGQVHEIEGLMVEPLNLVDDLLADRARDEAVTTHCEGVCAIHCPKEMRDG